MSTDPYPTEEELKRISEWDLIAQPDARLLMDYVKSLWWMPDWGWHESREVDELHPNRVVDAYHISTGGWSGNECLLSALQENHIFWGLYWVQHRRGGHYIFHIYDLPKSRVPLEELKE